MKAALGQEGHNRPNSLRGFPFERREAGRSPGGASSATGRSLASRALLRWAENNGLFFALVALVIAFAVASSRFVTGSNITVILLQVSVIGVIAVPGAMLVLAGYVDLSVGSVSALAAIVFGQVATQIHLGEGAALAVALLAGIGWGLMNGLLIAYAGFSAIVVTLGGLAGAQGLAEVLSGGITQSNFSNWFLYIGNGSPGGVPLPIWILLGAVGIGAYVWYAMPFGRYFTAIGADRSTALSLGINVRREILWLYVVSGLAAAIGGIVLTSQLDAASLTIGQGEELQVLTAILLGGVSFVGGRGTLFGVVIGVLFIGVLDDGLVLVNVNPFINDVAVGAALVFAAGLDVVYRRLERVRRSMELPPGDAGTAVTDDK